VLLKAPPAFDISHSEPRWPQPIFVSVPGKRGQVSALRAAGKYCARGNASAFFSKPGLLGVLNVEGADYVARRRAEIAEELTRIDFDRLVVGMTPDGLALILALRRNFSR
jgi:hypothetical protein